MRMVTGREPEELVVAAVMAHRGRILRIKYGNLTLPMNFRIRKYMTKTMTAQLRL